MAKKPVKETSTALIFATVFFVLTTIAFGVMWYMEFAERDNNKAAAEKDKKEVVAARGEVADAKLDSQAYRIFFGVDDEEDRKAVPNWADKDKKRVAETIKKLRGVVVEKVAKGDASKMPAELVLWDVTESGLPSTTFPPQSPLAVIGNLSADRDAAITKEKETDKLYAAAVKAMTDASKAYNDAATKYGTLAAALPADFDTKLKAEIKKFEDRKTLFVQAEAKSRKELDELKENEAKLEREKKKLSDQVGGLTEQLTAAVAKAAAVTKTEALSNDEPQGKVLRRLADGVIEINLGSEDLVRPGLTFTVLPNDFPEKGRQSRVKVVRVRDDRGVYRNAERFVEKANIEVVQVVGPHLSRARITQEYDPIRDGAAPGDLLYNAAWRKGTADHIALIGLFDVNGDGTDDIEGVIRDLTHMGIPVDAYYDMKARKWVGQITEQTRYVVEGQYPIQAGMDPNRDDKTKLLGDLAIGVNFARQKGVATVSYRDYFPRMGYKIKLDINTDKVNQATAPYLNKVNVADAPPMNPGN